MRARTLLRFGELGPHIAVQGSTNFYSAFESELGDVIPIVHTTIGGTRIVGRLTAGS